MPLVIFALEQRQPVASSSCGDAGLTKQNRNRFAKYLHLSIYGALADVCVTFARIYDVIDPSSSQSGSCRSIRRRRSVAQRERTGRSTAQARKIEPGGHTWRKRERRDAPLARRRGLRLMIFIGAPRTRDSILSGKRRIGNKFGALWPRKSYLRHEKLCSAAALHNL